MSNKKNKIIFGATAGVGAMVSVLLSGIYEKEGGYVNHKADRGGETHSGITIGTARGAGYTGKMKDFSRECYTEKDVCADKIYYTDYVVKPGFLQILQMSEPVGAEVIDTGVLMGQPRSSRFLQESLNEQCVITPKLKVDGIVGPGTHARFKACEAKVSRVSFCRTMLTALDAKQLDRFNAIVKANPSQKVFYKGWVNKRINNVDRKLCDKLV